MFLIYQLLLTLVILISPFIIIVRILKGKEDIKRFKEKFCLFSKKTAFAAQNHPKYKNVTDTNRAPLYTSASYPFLL